MSIMPEPQNEPEPPILLVVLFVVLVTFALLTLLTWLAPSLLASG